MANKTLSKRLVALLLTVAVIFSSFATLSFSAFATDPTAELVYDSTAAGITDDLPFSIENKVVTFKEGETNLLVGKKYDVFGWLSDDAPWPTLNANNMDRTIDGSTSANADIWANGANRTVNVVFYLESTVTPEYFAFIQNADKTLQTYKYEVYGAATYTALRNEPTLLGSYVRTDEAADDRQVNVFKFPEEASGIKYIMIRLMQDNFSRGGGYRPVEFILTGDAADDRDISLYESETKIVPTENAFTSVQTQYWRGGSYLANETTAGHTDLALLQDGALGTAKYFNPNKGFSTDSNGDGTHDAWITEGEFTIDIIYDLGENKTITNILVSGYTNSKRSRIGKYKLYAATDRDELFNNEIAEYTNAAAVKSQYFTFDGNVSGQYVAIRVLKPVVHDNQADYGFWLEEFRVYGTEYVQPAGWIYNGSWDGMTDMPISISGKSANSTVTVNDGKKNVLIGAEYDYLCYSDLVGKRSDNFSSLAYAADGLINNVDLQERSNDQQDIVFYLDKPVTPEYFAMISRIDVDPSWQLHKYEIYGAETYEDIRNNPTLLISYKGPEDTTTNQNVNIYKFDEDVTAINYLLVRITDASYTQTGIRFHEIVLIGEEGEAVAGELHQSDRLDNISIANPLTSDTISYTLNGSPVTLGNPERLQDGIYTSEAWSSHQFFTKDSSTGTITWLNDGTRYVDIVYDFGIRHYIDNVLVVSHNDLKLRTGKYVIYAGNDKDTLFTEGNIKFTFENEARSQRQVFTPAAEIQARYVAMRVYNPVIGQNEAIAQNNQATLRLYEFRVFGTSAVTMHEVKFLDRMGNVIHTASVEDGATVPEADILAANVAVPAIYGYDKYIDEATGMQGWSGDVAEPVTAPATFTALYVRNSATYTVSVQKVGEEAVTLAPMKFDERIELIDENAAVWTVNGKITAEGTNTCAYVFGNMAIVAVASAPAEATSVSIIGINKDGGSLTAFAHIYNTDASVTVEKFGIIFVSGTTYDKIKDQNDWSESTLNADSSLRHARTTITADSTNYMSTLTGIPTDSYVRRICRAYAVLSNGTTVYSDAIVNEFGSK